MRRFFGVALAALLALATPVYGYFAAAILGSLIPVHAGWRQPESGIRIYVIDNGVHTGIAMPKHAAGIDLRPLAPVADLKDARWGWGEYLVFGWGDRDFYRNTPTWADLNLRRTLLALAGMGGTVMHVEHLMEPEVEPGVRSILLRPDEYRRLADYIRGSFAAPGSGTWPGYYGNDAFYAATDGYNVFVTCNEWTGRALRHAGVRMGVWTPFSFGVTWWL
ncbi:MAG: TIGR02117 family protein [Pseudomonadota bacterium]